jgi:hypothetical protein
MVFLFLFDQSQPSFPGFGIEKKHTDIDPLIPQRARSVAHNPVYEHALRPVPGDTAGIPAGRLGLP